MLPGVCDPQGVIMSAETSAAMAASAAAAAAFYGAGLGPAFPLAQQDLVFRNGNLKALERPGLGSSADRLAGQGVVVNTAAGAQLDPLAAMSAFLQQLSHEHYLASTQVGDGYVCLLGAVVSGQTWISVQRCSPCLIKSISFYGALWSPVLHVWSSFEVLTTATASKNSSPVEFLLRLSQQPAWKDRFLCMHTQHLCKLLSSCTWPCWVACRHA